MKFLSKCLGGSNMYGLNSPESDLDYRGVFVNTDIGRIIGLDTDKFETIDKKGDIDEVYYELRHFMRLLRKTNSVVMELLWNEKWMESSPEWELILSHRDKLIDSHRFMASLTGGLGANYEAGYVGNEIRLMTGERTGLLGSKRKNTLIQYGYSYKNAVQALRLIYSSIEFFKTGVFTPNFEGNHMFPLVRDIKFHPKNYTVEVVVSLVNDARAELIRVYESGVVHSEFDNDCANDLCNSIYKQFL